MYVYVNKKMTTFFFESLTLLSVRIINMKHLNFFPIEFTDYLKMVWTRNKEIKMMPRTILWIN